MFGNFQKKENKKKGYNEAKKDNFTLVFGVLVILGLLWMWYGLFFKSDKKGDDNKVSISFSEKKVDFGMSAKEVLDADLKAFQEARKRSLEELSRKQEEIQSEVEKTKEEVKRKSNVVIIKKVEQKVQQNSFGGIQLYEIPSK